MCRPLGFADKKDDRRADREDAARGRGGPLHDGQAVHLHLGLGEPGLHRLPAADLVPARARTLIDFGASTILRDVGFEQFDAVAGGETAGIPFAAWMADRLDLPMQYVRKKPKGFGRNAQIEGEIWKASACSWSRT